MVAFRNVLPVKDTVMEAYRCEEGRVHHSGLVRNSLDWPHEVAT